MRRPARRAHPPAGPAPSRWPALPVDVPACDAQPPGLPPWFTLRLSWYAEPIEYHVMPAAPQKRRRKARSNNSRSSS